MSRKPSTLPLLVIGLIAPLAAGLALFGPQGMVLAAALVGLAIVVLVSRPRRDRPIEVAGGGEGAHHVLIAVTDAIASRPAAGRVVDQLDRLGSDGGPDVLVVSPALNPRLDHWAVDVADARARAEARLDESLGQLSRAGLEARGTVGDSNPMLAIEDALREFPADEVVLVSGADSDGDLEAELRERLDRPVTAVDPERAI